MSLQGSWGLGQAPAGRMSAALGAGPARRGRVSRAGGKFDTQKIRSQAARLFLRAGSPAPSEIHPLWGLRTVGLEGDSPARGTSRGNRRPRVSVHELTRRVGTTERTCLQCPRGGVLVPPPAPYWLLRGRGRADFRRARLAHARCCYCVTLARHRLPLWRPPGALGALS